MSSAAVSRCFSSTSSPSFNQHRSLDFRLGQRSPSLLSLPPNLFIASVIVSKEEEALAGGELTAKSGVGDDETSGSEAASLLSSSDDRSALVAPPATVGGKDDAITGIIGEEGDADLLVEGTIAVVLFVLRSVRSSGDGSVFVGSDSGNGSGSGNTAVVARIGGASSRGVGGLRSSRFKHKRGVGSDDAALARTLGTGRALSRSIDSRFERNGTEDLAVVPEAFVADDTQSGINGVTERGLRLLCPGQLLSSRFVRMVVLLLVVPLLVLAASSHHQSPIIQLFLLVWFILL
mmetsp:Transcript_11884/g.25102  ORF Transcript_11884/g.25102 Transcript_11884/m.25102 type:complete len:291 (-) Transcript_11884:39-911(-)